MSNFRAIDREAGFLLPRSVGEWLPEKYPTRFVVEQSRNWTCRQWLARLWIGILSSYHPAVLLSVLAYGYATAVSSSRRLESGTYGDDLAISTRCRFIAW